MPSVFNQQNYRQKRRFRIKLYAYSAIIVLIAIFIFYLIAYSPIFQIREFKIAGNRQISVNKVMEILELPVLSNKIYLFLGPKNLLSWNKKEINFSKTSLKKAEIKRDWLKQTLNITVEEREQLAIWCGNNNQCHWIDENGLLFDEAPETEGSMLLTVYADKALIEGTKISEERFIKNVVAVLKNIPSLNLPVKKIIFDGHLQELRAETYSGPNIFFSIRFNPELNIGSLQKLEEKTNVQNLRYIDLRVENRLYYKL